MLSGYRFPIGPDGPVYSWLARWMGEVGLRDGPGAGPGVPALTLTLSGALRTGAVGAVPLLGPVLAAVCGLAAGGLVSATEASGRFGVVAAVLLTGSFTAYLAGGWLANVTMVALFLSALAALAVVERSWRVAPRIRLADGWVDPRRHLAGRVLPPGRASSLAAGSAPRAALRRPGTGRRAGRRGPRPRRGRRGRSGAARPGQSVPGGRVLDVGGGPRHRDRHPGHHGLGTAESRPPVRLLPSAGCRHGYRRAGPAGPRRRRGCRPGHRRVHGRLDGRVVPSVAGRDRAGAGPGRGGGTGRVVLARGQAAGGAGRHGRARRRLSRHAGRQRDPHGDPRRADRRAAAGRRVPRRLPGRTPHALRRPRARRRLGALHTGSPSGARPGHRPRAGAVQRGGLRTSPGPRRGSGTRRGDPGRPGLDRHPASTPRRRGAVGTSRLVRRGRAGPGGARRRVGTVGAAGVRADRGAERGALSGRRRGDPRCVRRRPVRLSSRGGWLARPGGRDRRGRSRGRRPVRQAPPPGRARRGLNRRRDAAGLPPAGDRRSRRPAGVTSADGGPAGAGSAPAGRSAWPPSAARTPWPPTPSAPGWARPPAR